MGAYGSKIRIVANWVVPVALGGMYLHAMFIDPTRMVGDMSPTTGADPKETWAAMGPTARGLAPQLAGWAGCYAITSVCMQIQ